MTDQQNRPSKLFSRKPATVDVQGFLNGLVDSAPEVQQMREALANADREITAFEQRIRVLEQELHRITRTRDEWMAVANEMQVQLEVIASTAASAAEQTTNAAVGMANQAKNSLRAAKERLARSGMAMQEPSVHSNVTDEDTKKIARMLSRKPSETGKPANSTDAE
jgi:D-mannonate dehydratase